MTITEINILVVVFILVSTLVFFFKFNNHQSYLLQNVPLWKLKLFNEVIANAAQGEEKLSGDDSRLFTKIRKEFQAWNKTLDNSSMKGKR